MAAGEHDIGSERGEAREGANVRSGLGRGRPSSDAVVRALAEVEQTLERLKQVRAERALAETRFRTELADRERQIEQLRGERGQGQARLAELEARLAEVEAAGLDSRREAAGRVEASEAERNAAVERLGETGRRLGETEAALATERATRETLETRLATSEGAGAAETAGLRSELELAQRRADELADLRERERGEAEATSNELRERLAAVEDSTGAQVGELRGTIEALEARAAEAEARAAEQERRAGEAESALAARGAEVEDAAVNLSILDRKIAEQGAEIERLSGELGEARSRAEGWDRERSERVDSAEAARVEMAEALAAEREQVRAMTEKLDLAADRLVELQTALAERDQAIERAGDVDETAAELAGQVRQLREQLRESERRREEAERNVGEEGTPATAHREDPRGELRRRRLHRYRQLLRERARAAARADAVLGQRVKQCDELLARRRELSEARQIIERTHKKITSGRAKSGAAAAVFFGIAVVTVLSGLSWAVVTRTFPATYAASAVLAPDFDGAAVGPGDLEAWQAFHEQLLLDPNVMARVAERMTQRGFADLGQPAVVKAMLEDGMTWSSPQAGKLVVEMRGLGREATARRLDTYVTTLAVEANALRQRRSEPSTTVVIEPARAGVEPIEDPRLRYTGIGVAAGTALSMVLWFGLWRRMVKTKTAFENETAIEGLLEEAKWVDPIQQIINARADGDGAKAA